MRAAQFSLFKLLLLLLKDVFYRLIYEPNLLLVFNVSFAIFVLTGPKVMFSFFWNGTMHLKHTSHFEFLQ